VRHASAARAPMVRCMHPSLHMRPRGGGCGVLCAGGEALLGWCLVRRAWRSPRCAVHTFTSSSPGGGMAPASKSGRSWMTLVAGC
jgi:hypothetical protein